MNTPYAYFEDDALFSSPIGKIVCVGRNYAAHARELNNPVPTTPILFIKPASAACDLREPLVIPHDRGEVHYETELALLIGAPLTRATESEALAAVEGVGLALDLTLRDLQTRLKEQGHPWEVAKAFDGACPLSPFRRVEGLAAGAEFLFTTRIDGEIRQQGNSRDMLQPIAALLSYMSQHFTLLPGDIVLTGTPAGVGPLKSGQTIEMTLGDDLSVSTRVR